MPIADCRSPTLLQYLVPGTRTQYQVPCTRYLVPSTAAPQAPPRRIPIDCCDVYADQFDRDSAISQAERYRRRGLAGTARVLFEAVTARGIEGARVVDVGGGVGALGLELVKAGAASAVNFELSASYRDAALALAFEAGLEDRMRLEVGDAAVAGTDLGQADVIVMNRVICCYTDGVGLIDAAIAAAPRLIGMSYPSVHLGSRAVIGVENRLRARRGSEFRTVVHPLSTILRPTERGFDEVFRRRRPIWSVRVWELDRGAVIGGDGPAAT